MTFDNFCQMLTKMGSPYSAEDLGISYKASVGLYNICYSNRYWSVTYLGHTGYGRSLKEAMLDVGDRVWDFEL